MALPETPRPASVTPPDPDAADEVVHQLGLAGVVQVLADDLTRRGNGDGDDLLAHLQKCLLAFALVLIAPLSQNRLRLLLGVRDQIAAQDLGFLHRRLDLFPRFGFNAGQACFVLAARLFHGGAVGVELIVGRLNRVATLVQNPEDPAEREAPQQKHQEQEPDDLRQKQLRRDAELM